MARKRLTQIFPWLLPLRQWQRKKTFYAKMHYDRNTYANLQIEDELPYLLFEDKSLMINVNSGHDIQYQYNKVHNLKLAAATINKLVIQPNETFSFWSRVKGATKEVKYKEGIGLVDGKIAYTSGGGLCQISNLLFWGFTHTPLTIVERHGHIVKAFPNPPSEIPEGMDATIFEGWKDLKVKNNKAEQFQLVFKFDEEYITLQIRSNVKPEIEYGIRADDLCFYRSKGKIFERISIFQTQLHHHDSILTETLLYENCCEIGYPLPENTKIEEE